MSHPSLFQAFIDDKGFVVVDGGLATQLEKRGHDLDHPLWSARLLLEGPEEIAAVHDAYLLAGADCLITASYQASVPGLVAEGLSEGDAHEVLKRSVSIARTACDSYAANLPKKGKPTLRPIVAASVGPFGASLADGSEYTGYAGVSNNELHSFHYGRWQVLCDSGADLVACETIPSFQEAEVLVKLLAHTPDAQAWFSFSCRDDHRISDGTPFERCVSLLADNDQVVAVGINCTSPVHVPSLITIAREVAPQKHVVVYPNSGEVYDAASRSWMGETAPIDFGIAARKWFDKGAAIIGGCCRTGPEHIRAIRESVSSR